MFYQYFEYIIILNILQYKIFLKNNSNQLFLSIINVYIFRGVTHHITFSNMN